MSLFRRPSPPNGSAGEAGPPAHRRPWLPYTLLLFFVPAVLVSAWWFWPRSRAYYADAGAIRTPVHQVTPRDVLWKPPIELPGLVNSDADDFEPRFSADGLTLFFVRGRPAAGRDGPDADVFVSRKMHEGWSEPESLAGVNGEFDDLGPEPAADDQTLFFYSNRPGGQGGYDLWVAACTPDGCPEPTPMGPGVNSPFNEYGPALSPDGRTLYFASNRPRATDANLPDPDAWPATVREDLFVRDYDLYVVELTEQGWTDALPLANLNTPFNDGAPAVSPVGDFLYFASDRPGGQGGFDLYRARRLRGQLLPPENLGIDVNTKANELDPALTLDGFGLSFSSDRSLALAPLEREPDYNLYYTASREVFRDVESLPRPEINWAAFWALVGPILLWLLATLLFLLLAWWMWGALRSYRLSLLSKCLLTSLFLHLLMLLMFNVWQVGTALAGHFQGKGAIQVALAPQGAGNELAAQLRGDWTEVGVPSGEPATIPRHDFEPSVPLPATAVELPPVAATARLEQDAVPQPRWAEAPAAASEFAIPPPSPTDWHRTSDFALPETQPLRAAEGPPAEPTPRAAEAPQLEPPRPPDAVGRNPAPAAMAVLTPNPTLDPRAESVSSVWHSPSTATLREAPLPVDTPSSMAREPRSQSWSLGELALPTVASKATEPFEEPPAPAPPDAAEPPDTPRFRPNQALEAPASWQLEVTDSPAATPGSAAPSSLSKVVTVETRSLQDAPIERAAVELDPNWQRSWQSARNLDATASMALQRIELPPTAKANPSDPVESDDKNANRWHSIEPGDWIPVTPTIEPITMNVGGYQSPTQDFPPPSHTLESAKPGRIEKPPILQDAQDWASEHDDLKNLDTISVLNRTPASARPVWSEEFRIPDELRPPENPFPQRSAERRQELVERMGGSDETERAVTKALAWLARHQSEDGSWSGSRFDDRCGGCGGETGIEVDSAMTGLALLCFLGADHTHAKEGPYQAHVRRGLHWLKSRQARDGDLRGSETMYSQGIAAIALAEALAMTGDARLRDPVQRAVDFIHEARNRDVGGWRYDPGQEGDTSVLGWQVMALRSAKTAGAKVPRDSLQSARNWLRRVSSPSRPGRYSYQPGRSATHAMTAEAMFIQLLLGMRSDDPDARAAAKFLAENPPNWSERPNSYYWYYATLALFQQQGEDWPAWNRALTRELLAHQRTDGAAEGSWNPEGEWADVGGRVYQTALCTLMLEVYYRYLPMYTPRGENPPIGAVEGIISDAATGAPLGGATVRLDVQVGDALTATSAADGSFRLDVPEVPTFFAMTAVRSGYAPVSVNVAADSIRGTTFVQDFALPGTQAGRIAVESIPEVHHLGDNNFEGRINSQFQRKSEGDRFRAEFHLDQGATPAHAKNGELRMLVKGVQRRHEIRINGHLIEQRLDSAPDDGSFGEFRAPFDPALLHPGANTFEIFAKSLGGDVDDFEFVNVELRISE